MPMPMLTLMLMPMPRFPNDPLLLVPEYPHWPFISKGFTHLITKNVRLFCIKHWILGIKSFETNSFFSECSYHWLEHFFSGYCLTFSTGYLSLIDLICLKKSWRFDIYHLTIEEKRETILCLNIWKQLLETWKAESSFQINKKVTKELVWI